MSTATSLEEILSVISSVASGQRAARVRLPESPQPDDLPSRLGSALNVLLDELSASARAAEQMAGRLRTLTEAAHDFAEATREPQRLLDTVAQRLAEVVKDQCVVRLISDDGRALIPVSLYGADKEAERFLREIYSGPLPLEQYPGARRVHETGEPFVVAKLDPEAVRPTTTAQVSEWARRIGVHSLMMLALRHRGTSFGQLLLTRFRPDSPPFDEADLSLATALAHHAAIAIANSRAYAAESRSANELRASEARYRTIVETTNEGVWMTDEHERTTFMNARMSSMLGYQPSEVLGRPLLDFFAADAREGVARRLETRRKGLSGQAETVMQRKDGSPLPVFVDAAPLLGDSGQYKGALAMVLDLTERKRAEKALQQAEAQLRHSQKMEAVGILAGGVAHDFNNLLSVILSCTELVSRQLHPPDPLLADLDEIRKAGERAASLTRQLLLFSRRQAAEPKVIRLSDVLVGMEKMVRRIIGEDITLAVVAPSTTGRVLIDPGHIEQVIMNLVVNARDAMPAGGKLTLETGDVRLDDRPGVPPGAYVMLSVSDTGCGMDEATQARIFEPFFTTKEVGKGTGLGLSTVFGIVSQARGSVWVDSEPGKGSTFKVYLPAVEAEPDAAEVDGRPAGVRGNETVLLVEDDEQVRKVTRITLAKDGYQVLEARSGADALVLAERHPGPIHLLLSDVVMPEMSGPEVAKRILQARPDTKVLCMSGYTDEMVLRHGILEAGIAFLQKPITPERLLKKVREVLETTPR